MTSVLFKSTLILFLFLAVNSQKRIDNPGKEFDNFLNGTDDKIREITKYYQHFERKYRKHSRVVVKLINITTLNVTKELEIPLKIIYLNYTKSLKKKPFSTNDAEDINPKKVCNKAYDSIKEYDSMMMIFLAKNSDLQTNLTTLNIELNRVNSSNFNVSELQSNFTVKILCELSHLVKATEKFITASNQAAFNISNVLMTLKTRVMNYCGSINGVTTTWKTRKTTTRRTPVPRNVTRTTKYPWGINVKPVDDNVKKNSKLI